MSVTKYVIPSAGDRYGLLAIYDILLANGLASDITSRSNNKNLTCKLACLGEDRALSIWEHYNEQSSPTISAPDIIIQNVADETYTDAQRVRWHDDNKYSGVGTNSAPQRYLYLDTNLNWYAIVWGGSSNVNTSTFLYVGKNTNGDWVMFANSNHSYSTSQDMYKSYCYGTFFATDTDYRTYKLVCDQNEITSNGEYAQRDIMMTSFDTNEIVTNSAGQPVTLQGLKNLCVNASNGLTEGENYDYFHMTGLLPTNRSSDYLHTAFKLDHDEVVIL